MKTKQKITSVLSIIMTATILYLPLSAETLSEEDGWKFGGSLYLWGAGVKGTSSAGDEIDVSFSDILKDLDGALMGGIAARKGKVTLLADVMALRIHQESGNTDVKLKGYLTTFGAAYRVIENDTVNLDLLLGGRYFKMYVDLDINDGVTTSSYSESGDTLDGIIGAQIVSYLNKRWYLSMYADVGAGDSKLTWQAWPGIGYELENFDAVVGYRYLKWETDNGDYIDDLSFSGPMIGLKFRF